MGISYELAPLLAPFSIIRSNIYANYGTHTTILMNNDIPVNAIAERL